MTDYNFELYIVMQPIFSNRTFTEDLVIVLLESIVALLLSLNLSSLNLLNYHSNHVYSGALNVAEVY